MNEKLDLAIRIIVWSLIGMALFLMFLKYIGVLHSPVAITLETLVGAGILGELLRLEGKIASLEGRLETKIGALWSDFESRRDSKSL